MKLLGAIKDPTFTGKNYNRFDRFFLQFIKDERDLPFIYLTLRITFVLIPLSVLLFMPFVTGWVWWTIAAAHFYVSNFVFKGPFGLMLHCTSHRQFFKSEYGWMNNYLPWIVAPFFGHTPETYYSHHIGMHHPENNLEDDDSSTMTFQRDSFRSFLAYFGRFFVIGVRNLLAYLHRKNRSKLATRALTGEIVFAVIACVLLYVNWAATVLVFLFPLLVYRLIAMMGNWTQHAFVDGDEPGNAYKNSITCINVKYNKKCWNDGYHISHHVRPALHWTEHPTFFQKTIDKYAHNQAIVFDGLDFLQIFFLLMRGRYDVLVKNMVNINGAFASDEEAIALLRRRTRRIMANDTVLDVPQVAVA
ncbi:MULTISPECIES: fatty acid desaturase [unclassified Spirosoma]|uniref:fatty acid desaturase family protein n=1 Tax=unclassified Spirosoma TaxID=2621999 RepID=UPI000966B824|nr:MULTISPECIES: fatty acid desaturase [unclassified Spirosoma]MBN8824230.1 fatty acid desaturase [Spirosoma sp.]OJW78962.1 MAG: fatty acid desaturase [Spirosoma sp. 48-14]